MSKNAKYTTLIVGVVIGAVAYHVYMSKKVA